MTDTPVSVETSLSDRLGRPIPIIDPYMERELIKNYGEQFGAREVML